MTPAVLFLMAITLNVKTGEEMHRTMVSGPYKTVLECERANFATGFQKPAKGKITIFNCVQLAGGTST